MNNVIYPRLNFQIVSNISSHVKLSAINLKIIAVAAIILFIIAGLAFRIYRSMKSREVVLYPPVVSQEIPPFNVPEVFLNLQQKTKKVPSIMYSETNCRFTDVLCPVDTQVKITGQNRIYLHANHVSLAGLNFIASQYPKIVQFPFFWRAASKASLVIDLTNRADMKKGLQSYHPPLNEEISLDVVQVKCLSKQFFQNIAFPLYTYSVEGLPAEDGVQEGPHQISRLHYEGWSDHSSTTADDLDSLLAIIEHYQKESGLPVLIHCRAGVGRTGTFIVIRAIKQLIDQGVINSPSSLKAHLCRLILEGRQQRGPFFVQTLPQLEVLWTWGLRYFQKKGRPSPQLILQPAELNQ